ncbi:cysteine desulfurase family protein [Microbacterium xanthum]|uniref:cysteine desulfurase family protein n=1 Tax=Microbacterium xanthum TaxID=3079794 RepID=UPI002AD3D0D4|nr:MULTISPECIES: cysteine desulfurase family protein [unclassified Microbacterium]MDZ8172356.1 cysteine desulfurase family protein [Microbacterium sp. KSW-48]MDZ8201926.1 cysteine desulfurase family protein [Microbacterium sp. SSW1-59]
MVVYLDHAAGTPLRPEARDAWLAAQAETGNASAIHTAGQRARRLLEEARERLAAVLGCGAIEVVFTSGGTEAVNLAVKGLWEVRADGTEDIVLPDGEHHATRDAVAWLAGSRGAGVRPVPLDPQGRIRPGRFAEVLPGAAIATALVANNEVGTRNDAGALARAAATAGVPLHLDAVSAFGHLPVDFASWRADARGATGLVALSVSAHKVGGPVGVGALVVSRHAEPSAQLHGGGQQRALRAGTQDIAGASAFAVAAELAVAELADEAARLAALREQALAAIRREIPDVVPLGDPVDRIPGNLHLHFPGAGGEAMLFLLDQRGVAVSTGSACQAGVPEPSHVVQALGYDDRAARQVLRVSFGRTSTGADVEALAAALPDVVTRARASR